MGWFIAGIIAAPILWFIFKIVVGATAPPEVSGKHLLKQELAKLGVNPSTLPEACLAEFVQSSKDRAEETKDLYHQGYFSSAFAEHLEVDARYIAEYLDGKGARNEDNYCYQILVQHGVIKP